MIKLKFTLISFLFLLQLPAQTSLDWVKRIGGTADDGTKAIKVDTNGNIYAGGYFTGIVDFDPGAGIVSRTASGFCDAFLAKYDANGNYLWVINIDGSNGLDAEYISDIILDDSANVYVTGQAMGGDFDPGPGVNSINNPNHRYTGYLAKYSSSGNLVWLRSFVQNSSSINGGSTRSLTFDTSGNILLTGMFDGVMDADPGGSTANLITGSTYNIFYAKYTHNGDFIWAKNIGGPGIDMGYGISCDSIGDVYITGGFEGTADFLPGAGTANLISVGFRDVYVAKYSGIDGSYIWAKGIGGSSEDYSYHIEINHENNVLVTGSFSSTTDFDPGPSISNLTSSSSQDVFLLHLDALGNYIWAKKIGSTGFDEGFAFALDDSSNIYLTGCFEDTVDFDLGTGTALLTSYGGNDIFMAKYDKNGNYIWAFNMGGTAPGEDSGRDVCVMPDGYIYCTGVFQLTSTFDPGPPAFNLTSAGARDIFITKHFDSTICVPHVYAAASICPGDSIAFGTQTLYTPGTYNEPFVNVYGCNYTTTLTLSYYSTNTTGASASFCHEGTYNWGLLVLNSPGVYNQTFQNIHGCDSIVALTLNEINVNTNITLSGSHLHAVAGGAIYQWINCSTNLPISGATSQNYTPTSNGNYAVILTQSGCQDTSVCYNFNILGMDDEFNDFQIQVYPNPVNDNVSIAFNEGISNCCLRLVDLTGKTVMNLSNLSGEIITLDVEKYSSGIYFLEINIGNRFSRVKLIKK